MILEYGHIYVDDLINNNINLKKLKNEIDLVSNIKRTIQVNKSVVLIDDKAHFLSNVDKLNISFFVQSLYEQFGLKPEMLFFEKDFEKIANEILKSIPKDLLKTEYFRKSQKRVTFLKVNGYSIPLKEHYENHEKYTCPILSASWLTYKKDKLCDKHYNTLTVLSKKYEKVEEQVHEILKVSGYQEHYFKNNEYVWT